MLRTLAEPFRTTFPSLLIPFSAAVVTMPEEGTKWCSRQVLLSATFQHCDPLRQLSFRAGANWCQMSPSGKIKSSLTLP